MDCTHPDHNENGSCIEGAVGCHRYCICCVGEYNAMSARLLDKGKTPDEIQQALIATGIASASDFVIDETVR